MYILPFSDGIDICSDGSASVQPRAMLADVDWNAVRDACLFVDTINRAEWDSGVCLDSWADSSGLPRPKNWNDVISQFELFKLYKRQPRAGLVSPRSKFDSRRKRLLKRMLERGDEYVCSHGGCSERADLCIDHIVPLAKGGTNDLENLQFLCRTHNSRKGVRVPVEA